MFYVEANAKEFEDVTVDIRVGYKIYTYLNINKFLKRPPFFGYACHSEFRTLENK